MVKKIIIIGGGISGLAAGCYAQMNGYDSVIFESHSISGGLCTTWKRAGYSFDGCLHWLVGTRKGHLINDLWSELGVADRFDVIDNDEYIRIHNENAISLVVNNDMQKFKKSLLLFSPEDSDLIHELIEDICFISRFQPALEQNSLHFNKQKALDKISYVKPYAYIFRRYMKLTLEEYLMRFKSEELRKAFLRIFSISNLSMLSIVMTLGYFHDKNAGLLRGGSDSLSKSLEKKYLSLNGAIKKNSYVKKIIVSDSSASGVILDNDQSHYSDLVISAADGYKTIFELLEGKFVNTEITNFYNTMPLFPSLILVSFGIKMDMSGYPHYENHVLTKPVFIGGSNQEYLAVRHFSYDDSLCPKGRSVIQVRFYSDFEYWKNFCRGTDKYENEKLNIEKYVLSELERLYPGITESVETTDISTPLTISRYTHNRNGSFEGWLCTPQAAKISYGKGLNAELPGLQNFYMCGHWVKPGGGVPFAALSAREVIQKLCTLENRTFTHSV
ncbi:MAG: NAD(P)/FAD-dependent oxidoreductase [Spirochaetes bacterium]|nr:NAD(P)/FAD-dependent oxidoreductase [Spirochaetota bacterium]